MAATDIKYFTFENLNAPQLQNAYGAMIGVLDACLVTGLALPQVADITFEDGIATISFNTEHKLRQYQVIEISGANVAELNTQHRLLSVTSTTATFNTSVTTAGGTFIARLPPLGWEKLFGSSNANGGGKAAYRSMNLLLPSRPFLRVVDEPDPAYASTYAKYAKVGIVEDMTDIDTMLGVQAPYDASSPLSNWVGTGTGTSAINGWARWYYARQATFEQSGSDVGVPVGGNRVWFLIGSGDCFYVLPGVSPSTLSTRKSLYGFGAFDRLTKNDNSNTFLASCIKRDPASQTDNIATNCSGTSSIVQRYIQLQRNYKQDGRPGSANSISLNPTNNIVYSGSSDITNNKNLAGASPFAPVYILDGENVLRGMLPLLNWLFQKKPFLNNETIETNNSMYIAQDVNASNNDGQIVFYLGDL